MANEDLIYRITRAVYDRLGSTVDEATVEQLVMDIYNQVDSSSTVERSSAQLRPGEGSSGRMVISVFGLDHPGIVAGGFFIFWDARVRVVGIKKKVGQGENLEGGIINTHAGPHENGGAEKRDRLR